ncbi:MAG TPA: saccharopine dehydrogenase C-terminal domain-containing protein [Gammaproteobacteria bacterium]|jgi:saccharopine dehydrogenase-like NADP-dependent oxidoreductase|nr:saccharopine dehydrogenase C-terminal domain-containing protein [Gammaproteobacteria bacterium]
MKRILIIGAGKVGALIAFLLARSGQYTVYLADHVKDNPRAYRLDHLPHYHYVYLEAADEESLVLFVNQHHIQAVISSLPYFANVAIAKMAATCGIDYFDLTEDIKTTEMIFELAQQAESAFVPQCGLAPGFISIVANDLMRHFPTLDTVKMRVGALPLNTSNSLQYSLTWSTDGLINEYGNLCPAIEDGKYVLLQPLEDLEEIKIDGLTYEAFNTSGGIGSLAQTYGDKVKQLSYKTIRYPGHCEKIKFLMNDLMLNQNRTVLKDILETALPKTYQDVVLVYVSVTGTEEGSLSEKSYVRKFYPSSLDSYSWSAIQMTTASSVCAIVDLVMQSTNQYKGFIRQEQFSLEAFLNNRFGRYFS